MQGYEPGMIYSGSGSCFEFMKFRIRIPPGKKNLLYQLSAIFYFKLQSRIFRPKNYVYNFNLSALSFLLDPDPERIIPDPDPKHW